MTGQAGIDRRGVWVDDKITHTKIRLGEVGMNLAMTLAEQGNNRLAREVMAKPHWGVFVSREF